MRVLHAIYDDIGNPWLGGGGALRTIEIYSRIAAAGHRVVVVCGTYPGAARSEIRQGVRYRRVGSGSSYLASRVTYMIGAARLVRRGGYDIVVEDISPYSPVGAPLFKARHVPAVASVQNLSGSHATAKYGVAGWGPRLAEKALVALFSNFVAVSPGIADSLRAMKGSSSDARIRIVPNAVAPVFFEAERLPSSERYILSLGRVDVYQKGLDTLFAGYESLAERKQDIKLLIAGAGKPAEQEKIRALREASPYRDRIAILGPVERPRAAELMRGALLLAMPSRYEAWPLTALEAGAAGIPLVGFDITGVRDAAPQFPAAHGFLVPPGDAGALASTMGRLADDAGLREEAGRRGRQWAGSFTWDSLAAEQLAFYEDLVRL